MDKMSAEDRKYTSLSEDWHEFTEDVSMDGVRYVHRRRFSTFRRLVWFILIVGMLAYFCFAAYLFLNDFAKLKVNTKIRVETAEELQFPTITVCNKNLWRISVVYGNSMYLGGLGLFTIMEDLYNIDQPSPPPENKYNWSSPEYSAITSLTPNDSENFFRDTAHPFEETVSRCRKYGKSIECADLFEVLSTDGGYCAQLNSNGSLKASSAGKTGGLSFTLFTNVVEYTSGPFSDSEGFSLTFHDSHEVPLVSELSMGIAPGVEADFMLHKTSTNRKPPPADDKRANCFDTDKLSNPLHYYKNYSYSACQAECKATYVINKCGCRDNLQPPLNDTELCLIPEMLYCSTPALRRFPSDPDGLQACKCKDACSVSEYTAKIATTKFPSNKYVTIHHFDEATVKWASDNVLLVNIYYGKMSYQRLDEEFAYTITDMIANIGGTLGLCVGASILTICEFLEFGVRALIKCLTRKKKTTPTSASQHHVVLDEDSQIKHELGE